MYGCGTDEPNLPVYNVTGKVQQGPISGAFVFLDANGNGTYDANEPSAITQADGSYTLPVVQGLTIAAGAKVIVTYPTGALDITTGARPTGVLYAPVPANLGVAASTQNITPVTTMIAAVTDPTAKANLIAVLQAAGIDTSATGTVTTLNPAAMALVKTVEALVAASQQSVAAATNNPAKANLAATSVLTSIANSLSTLTAANVANSAALNATLTTMTTAAGTGLINSGALNAGTTTLPAAVTTALTGATSSVVTTLGGANNLTTTGTAVTESSVAVAISQGISQATTNAASGLTTVVTATAPTAAPAVVATSTSLTNVALPVASISVKLNENVTIASVNSTTVKLNLNGTPIAGTVSYDPVAYVITFTPSSALVQTGATYSLNLTSGITANGDATKTLTATTLTFTTASSLPSGATGSGSGSLGGTGINF